MAVHKATPHRAAARPLSNSVTRHHRTNDIHRPAGEQAFFESLQYLTGRHSQGLIKAHDGSAELIDAVPDDDTDEVPNGHAMEDEEIFSRVAQYTDKDIRIVRVEKTTDALVSCSMPPSRAARNSLPLRKRRSSVFVNKRGNGVFCCLNHNVKVGTPSSGPVSALPRKKAHTSLPPEFIFAKVDFRHPRRAIRIRWNCTRVLSNTRCHPLLERF